ncbi:hypothetical protein AAJP47_02540 [Psychrobacter sp. B38]|uniref:hypothetical protein n=1 Tax=Psychrobacter sp. B38 TaxID=3143538 RepID=UPI00320EC54D
MKHHTLARTNAKSSSRILPIVFVSALLMTACEKTPEPEPPTDTQGETNVQTTPVTTNVNVPESNVDGENVENEGKADTERDISLTQLEDDLETTDAAPASAAPNPEQAIKGAQITDVRYKSAAGETLSVVFETSAAGLLNAIVTLPNKPKMTLTAPEGQGNNPTYRSSDGSTQLVSHAGGGSIDLIRNNKITSFDAVSAEAEVVAE